MPAPPIDERSHERIETYEDTFQRVAADGILEAHEMTELAASWSDVRASHNELCGTVVHIRRASSAGINSDWVHRKAREHVRDSASIYTT